MEMKKLNENMTQFDAELQPQLPSRTVIHIEATEDPNEPFILSGFSNAASGRSVKAASKSSMAKARLLFENEDDISLHIPIDAQPLSKSIPSPSTPQDNSDSSTHTHQRTKPQKNRKFDFNPLNQLDTNQFEIDQNSERVAFQSVGTRRQAIISPDVLTKANRLPIEVTNEYDHPATKRSKTFHPMSPLFGGKQSFCHIQHRCKRNSAPYDVSIFKANSSEDSNKIPTILHEFPIVFPPLHNPPSHQPSTISNLTSWASPATRQQFIKPRTKECQTQPTKHHDVSSCKSIITLHSSKASSLVFNNLPSHFYSSSYSSQCQKSPKTILPKSITVTLHGDRRAVVQQLISIGFTPSEAYSPLWLIEDPIRRGTKFAFLVTEKGGQDDSNHKRIAMRTIDDARAATGIQKVDVTSFAMAYLLTSYFASRKLIRLLRDLDSSKQQKICVSMPSYSNALSKIRARLGRQNSSILQMIAESKNNGFERDQI